MPNTLAKLVLIILMFFATNASFAAGNDDAVGIVLDLQGTGQVTDKGNNSKLQLLTYLKPTMRISLPAGSKASLSLYETHSVYQIVGPSVIDIAKNKLSVISGAAPVVKSLAEKLVMAASEHDLQAGAYRMRAISPRIVAVTPENGTLLLRSQPTFSWAAMENGNYEITLLDQVEEIIASGKTTDTNWTLPVNVKLNNGGVYHWVVGYKSAKDGKTYTATAEFSLASQAEIDKLAELKPSDDAAIEEWILYAAMLQNKRMFIDAQAAWQLIGKQRPDLQKAHELAQ